MTHEPEDLVADAVAADGGADLLDDAGKVAAERVTGNSCSAISFIAPAAMKTSTGLTEEACTRTSNSSSPT
jgi:hypothetical protein